MSKKNFEMQDFTSSPNKTKIPNKTLDYTAELDKLRKLPNLKYQVQGPIINTLIEYVEKLKEQGFTEVALAKTLRNTRNFLNGEMDYDAYIAYANKVGEHLDQFCVRMLILAQAVVLALVIILLAASPASIIIGLGVSTLTTGMVLLGISANTRALAKKLTDVSTLAEPKPDNNNYTLK